MDPGGLEPTTFSVSARCSNQLSYGSKLSELGRIRTFDRLLRRQMLYPAELRVHVVSGVGFEPTYSESESEVLPLDEPPVTTDDRCFYYTASPCLEIRQVTRHAKVTAEFHYTR